MWKNSDIMQTESPGAKHMTKPRHCGQINIWERKIFSIQSTKA